MDIIVIIISLLILYISSRILNLYSDDKRVRVWDGGEISGDVTVNGDIELNGTAVDLKTNEMCLTSETDGETVCISTDDIVKMKATLFDIPRYITTDYRKNFRADKGKESPKSDRIEYGSTTQTNPTSPWTSGIDKNLFYRNYITGQDLFSLKKFWPDYMIVWYSGDPKDLVNTNWFICDGTKYTLSDDKLFTTPDFREQFIINPTKDEHETFVDLHTECDSEKVICKTQGDSKIKIKLENVPKHTHTMDITKEEKEDFSIIPLKDPTVVDDCSRLVDNMGYSHGWVGEIGGPNSKQALCMSEDKIVGDGTPGSFIHPDKQGSKMCNKEDGGDWNWWLDRDDANIDTTTGRSLSKELAALRWGNPIDPNKAIFRKHYPTLCCTAKYKDYGDADGKSLRDARTDCARNGGIWHTRDIPINDFVCEIPSQLVYTKIAKPGCEEHLIGFVPEPYPTKGSNIATVNKSAMSRDEGVKRGNTGINEHWGSGKKTYLPRVFEYDWDGDKPDPKMTDPQKFPKSRAQNNSMFNTKYNKHTLKLHTPDPRYNYWVKGPDHYACRTQPGLWWDNNQISESETEFIKTQMGKYHPTESNDPDTLSSASRTKTDKTFKGIMDVITGGETNMVGPRPYEWINRDYWYNIKRKAFIEEINTNTKLADETDQEVWAPTKQMSDIGVPTSENVDDWFGTENKGWREAKAILTGVKHHLCGPLGPAGPVQTNGICIDKMTSYMNMIYADGNGDGEYVTDVKCTKPDPPGRVGAKSKYNENCVNDTKPNTCNTHIVHDGDKVYKGITTDDKFLKPVGKSETNAVELDNSPMHINLYYIIKLPVKGRSL